MNKRTLDAQILCVCVSFFQCTALTLSKIISAGAMKEKISTMKSTEKKRYDSA